MLEPLGCKGEKLVKKCLLPVPPCVVVVTCNDLCLYIVFGSRSLTTRFTKRESVFPMESRDVRLVKLSARGGDTPHPPLAVFGLFVHSRGWRGPLTGAVFVLR